MMLSTSAYLCFSYREVISPDRNASDISRELWNLGFELFNDRDKMTAKFVEADVLDSVSGLEELKGSFDFIIAHKSIHIFNWEGQVSVIKRVVELSKPGTMLIGNQRARVPLRWMER